MSIATNGPDGAGNVASGMGSGAVSEVLSQDAKHTWTRWTAVDGRLFEFIEHDYVGLAGLDAGYRYTALGEVLARGQRSPDEVVRGRPCDNRCSTSCDASRRCDGWKQSPGHWRILTSARYRDAGVAGDRTIDCNGGH